MALKVTAPVVEEPGAKPGHVPQQRRRKVEHIERRNFIQGVGLAAGAAAAATLVEAPLWRKPQLQLEPGS
jgi:hypothetical protein